MSLPQLAINQRVTTVMLSFGVVFLGIIAMFSIQKELFPPLTFPQITVVTEYTNAAPEEIETLITRPLEEAISSTSGLRELKSVSQEGKSTIFASFGWNENIDFAALAVREKIDLVKERLPKESGDPIVLKYDPLAKPIMILSVTGKMSPVDLKLLSERVLKENLEKVDGVASATISGGLDREIQVELDQGRLTSAEVSILDVIDSIDNSNISYPAGSIKKGLYEYLIRTVGEFRSVQEIAYTVVATDVGDEQTKHADTYIERNERTRDTVDAQRGEQEKSYRDRRLIMLRDIGEVKDTFKEKTSISRYNGKENISIAIQKQGSANTVKVVERIRKEMDFLREDIASRGLQVEVVYDHSVFIKKAIKSVRDAAILGGIIAAFVLFPFFKDVMTALIVNVAIPIATIGTFFSFQLQGITLNTMSLAGLALGLGMMTDNSIVVIENIFRYREEGLSPSDAAVKGTNEVFWPVVTSTLTTSAVFLPMILFVPGVAGQLFKDLSWAVIHSLIYSLFVSVTLIPMLTTYIQLPSDKGVVKVSRFEDFKNQVKNYFYKLEPRAQNGVCWSIVAIGFGLFLFGLFIFRFLDTEVLPKVDQGQFLIKVDLPVGSRLEATAEMVDIIDSEIKTLKEVENVTVTIGSSASGKIGEVAVETLRSYQALIMVDLKDKRRRSSSEVVSMLKKKLDKHKLQKADIEYVLQESEFDFAQTGGKPIIVEVKGYDLEQLNQLTRKVEKALAAIPGVTEILNDVGEPSPETKVNIERQKAAQYAISARDISLTAKAAIEGAVATTFKEAGREIDVRVKLQESDREKLTQVGELLVYSNSIEIPIPIKEVADISQGYGPSEIRRRDQIRTVSVTAAIEKGYQEKSVLNRVQKEVDQIQSEALKDYSVDLTGKSKEIQESFRRIVFAIALALILNYMIMAAQFESFVHPFIIMFTVPLGIFGVGVALFVTGTALSVISLLGIMILGGNVVNNAIVLIDFVNGARREGVDLVQACIESVFVRFRPIIMSTITTIVGLIPLALGIGEGAELQAPLAIAMIGGLFSGTILTLLVIPAIYILVTRYLDQMFEEPYLEGEASS